MLLSPGLLRPPSSSPFATSRAASQRLLGNTAGILGPEGRILGVRTSMLKHVWTWASTLKGLLHWSGVGVCGLPRIPGVSNRSFFLFASVTDAYMRGLRNWDYVRSRADNFPNVDKHSETRRQHLPDAAACLCLQGKLWHAHQDLHKAVDCYVEALKLNPFLWDAFLGLCQTGKQ